MPETVGTTLARTCGFRFSRTDALVIAACAGATWALWRPLGELALVFPVVLLHFFLFCNVFRIRRSYELIWAGMFVLNLACWVLLGAFWWPWVLLAQTPLTLALIIAEMMSRRYHGAGWRWINPSLSRGQVE
jgi:hypothetical protein